MKTKKAIKSALITLVEQKGYERITIQDIADEAMINRNTFYLHYVDKIDLIESLSQESLEKLDVCFEIRTKNANEMTEELFKEILKETFNIIALDISFFSAMISDKGYPNFLNYLGESLKGFMTSSLSQGSTLRLNIILEYMISGLVGVICMWVKDSNRAEVDSIVQELGEIHFYNSLKLLNS